MRVGCERRAVRNAVERAARGEDIFESQRAESGEAARGAPVNTQPLRVGEALIAQILGRRAHVFDVADSPVAFERAAIRSSVAGRA